jgi:hypothetical protein
MLHESKNEEESNDRLYGMCFDVLSSAKRDAFKNSNL